MEKFHALKLTPRQKRARKDAARLRVGGRLQVVVPPANTAVGKRLFM
jgi:hypothetical protein